jgi:hypothetical protein
MLNGKQVVSGILQTGAWIAPGEESVELSVLFEE